MKEKLKKLGQTITASAVIWMTNMNSVFAEVTFNEGQAKSDLQNLLNPISNVLLFIALPLTLCAIGLSYIGWSGKDEEEKESMPFTKIVKKYVIAFVIFGLSGAILKWFSIS